MVPGKKRVLQLAAIDNAALALDDLAAGDVIAEGGIAALEPVPSGHKLAVHAIAAGAPVFKYGQIIGLAKVNIAPGQHVHVHNLSADARAAAELAPPASVRQLPARSATFDGYVRRDGSVGTRNYIGILTSVNCSATVARKIAEHFPDCDFPQGGAVDGVVALTHHTGCGMSATGDAIDILRRTLAGYIRHPNFAGVLIIGLGCEVNQIADLFAAQQLEESDTIHTLSIQGAGGTRAAIEQGVEIVRDLVSMASSMERTSVPAAHLKLGLQCGGSDGWSGVTANPALGRAADLLVAAGGTAILSETPEIFGAEQLLLARAKDDAVREKLMARIAWWEEYVARNGAELNNNPSPGNIKGGLTTILEKSLGAVAKSGASQLVGVYEYAEAIERSGFVFMDSPGYDPCSATGQTAAGANILAFTTGRGSVFGSKPAPCIKLASNARLAAAMYEDMDIDCSGILDGQDLDALGEEIFQALLQTASGQPSKSEALGLGDLEFVPWQLGAVM